MTKPRREMAPEESERTNRQARALRAKDPEKHRARDRERRAANLESERARNREYATRKRHDDPEAARAKKAEYRKRHRAELARRQREWNAANPEKVRAINLRKYGLTPDGFDAMLVAQGGACAICRSTDPRGPGSFAVDHCHSTGVVRGLLCHQCNLGLGKFGDDPARLVAAAAYLTSAVRGAA